MLRAAILALMCATSATADAPTLEARRVAIDAMQAATSVERLTCGDAVNSLAALGSLSAPIGDHITVSVFMSFLEGAAASSTFDAQTVRNGVVMVCYDHPDITIYEATSNLDAYLLGRN